MHPAHLPENDRHRNGGSGGGGGGALKGLSAARSGLFHEELVPLKGGEPNDAPPQRSSASSGAATRWIVGGGSHGNSSVRIKDRSSFRDRCISCAAIAASLLALLLCGWALILTFKNWRGSVWPSLPSRDPSRLDSATNNNVVELYDELGRYVMEAYDAQPPFSDFLPALAGYYGKPLYAFYVNRGQGIASFGFESKEYPIMEFNSATKAYQSTPLLGFRTFLQLSRRKPRTSDAFVTIEPFSPLSTRHFVQQSTPLLYDSNNNHEDDDNDRVLPRRYMYVGANEMQVREVDTGHGIETNVTYFLLPEEDFGAFVKRTTITNLNPRETLTLSVVDGLAKIEPAGGKLDGYLKNMGRTLEGWMGVYQPYNDTASMPFFRLSMLPGDTASVVVQEAGHWCLSVLESDDGPSVLPILVDPSKVFGYDTTFLAPVNLHAKRLADVLQEPQYRFAKTASAFSAVEDVVLPPGQSVTVSTFFGRADHILEVPVVVRRLTEPGFVEYKLERSREVVNQISTTVETRTALSLFDGHVQQVFLDNSLRGGVPSILGEVDDNVKMMSADEDGRLKVFHLFSRIHGDLERDYNSFVIAPTFFSQVRCVRSEKYN
jgi:hypothetical protein